MKFIGRRDALRAGAFLAVSSGFMVRGVHWPITRAKAALGRKTEFLAGLNVAGAEFGSNIPGRFGTDYTYPTKAGFTQYRALGFNVIRLPFRWERLQRDLYGAFDRDEWRRLSATILDASAAGFTVIVDPHNYARRRIRDDGFQHEFVIGSAQVPVEAFTHFWRELASRTKGWPRIIYGLMNEPYDMDAKVWFDIAQKGLSAIRASGANNLVLVPGTSWTGAHSWHDVGNTVMGEILDPANNFAIEVHQYLDDDSSGSSGQVTAIDAGTKRIVGFQDWARANGHRAFLGEFAGGNDPKGVAAVRHMLEEINANRDVWIGWTAWAGGPWWPDDFPFKLEPSSLGKFPAQARLLSEFARGR